MRLFLKFIHDVSGDENCIDSYRRIRKYFLDVYSVKKRWFRFEDSFINKHRGSSVLITKYPEMKPFLYFSKREWGDEVFEDPVLSNLDESWEAPNPYKITDDLTDTQLGSILTHIPGIYRFIRSSIAFDFDISDGPGPLPEKEKPVHTAYKRTFLKNASCSDSTLIFQNDRIEREGRNQLAFYLRLPNRVCYDKTLPELSSSLLSRIRGLGPIAASELFYIPDEIEFSQWEKKQKETRKRLGPEGRDLAEELIGLKKPNALTDPFFLLKEAGQKSSRSGQKIPKESIVRFYFGLKGYQRRPRLDTRESIMLVKSTKNSNALQVTVHFGSRPSQLGCLFRVRGMGWHEEIRIPFLPDYYQYPIVERESFEKAAENAAAAAAYLEKNVVPDIETIYGSSPAWFRADGEIYPVSG